MSVKAINQTLPQARYNNNQSKSPSFTGSFNPIIAVMDAIERGGFAASFIAQDGIGMVAPRISEGLNRNRPKDENGKKTGPLNWEFARREGIREILSGPSAFLIPAGILAVIKKTSGTANNVHTDHIKVLGDNFGEYVSKHTNQLSNSVELRKGYYAQVFENVLKNSVDEIPDLKQRSKVFADKLVKAEEFRANKQNRKAKLLLSEVFNEYMDVRKAHAAPSSSEIGVTIEYNGKKLQTNIRRLAQSLTDYSKDAIKHVDKNVKNITPESVSEYISKFNKHRAGTRVLSNLGMWSAVVGFYTLIPKLYNLGIKEDPGLKGLVNSEHGETKQGKDVAFTGGIAKIGETAMKDGGLGKLLKNFEFNGASMSVSAMLTLMFGFCLPPRYVNAKSDKERKEILVRDITSFVAILFGAKALSRGFSNMFSKFSGLALNTKPVDHQGVLRKIKNYFTAGNGINVLNSEQIVSKYSQIDKYKDGINGFFKFIQENGGNVKKVLKLDKTVKTNSEKIMKEFGGKTFAEASVEDIEKAFRKAKNSDYLNEIYEVFRENDNKFVTKAKTYNSAFGFMSTIVLVPTFMMWLARYCERMTKKAIARENEVKATEQNMSQQKLSSVIATDKPSMAGFLNNL